jgi:acetyltransferase-like isoleucine patch superfamily enzyme
MRRTVAKLTWYSGRAISAYYFRFRLANLICGLIPDFTSGALRARLYRWAGFHVGERAYIMGNIDISSAAPDPYSAFSVGSDTVISNHVTVNLDGDVSIGRYTMVGPYVLIYSGTHRMGSEMMRCEREAYGKAVRIEDGCWLRLGAVILPGVTIGRGSVIGAGAVVASDVPPNSYVEGNPARVTRQLAAERHQSYGRRARVP